MEWCGRVRVRKIRKDNLPSKEDLYKICLPYQTYEPNSGCVMLDISAIGLAEIITKGIRGY